MAGVTALLAFWSAFALAVVSPGPNFATLLAASVERGRPTAMRVAAGMVTGEVVWGLAAVFGVAALAAHQPWVGPALRIGGGLYLVYLGWGALRSASAGGRCAPPAPDSPTSGATRGGYLRGLAIMLLNAKAGFFWLSLTALVLGTEHDATTMLIAVAGATFISGLWHGMLAFAFTTRAVLRAYERVRRGLQALLGATLAALGLKVLAFG